MEKLINKIEYSDEILSSELGNVDKITDEIYQGSEIAAANLKNLTNAGITHIIVVGSGLSINFPDKFDYFQIEINDVETENIYEHFQSAYNFIEKVIECKGKVFIHCKAGISRSSAITCSYLIKKYKIKYAEALKILRKGRQEASPNSGFIIQLLKWYENEAKLFEI